MINKINYLFHLPDMLTVSAQSSNVQEVPTRLKRERELESTRLWSVNVAVEPLGMHHVSADVRLRQPIEGIARQPIEGLAGQLHL